MFGWNGRLLHVDLTKKNTDVVDYPSDLALRFLGGRGFAVKLLWDLLEPGVDPFSPRNILIAAAGPLTGLPIPNSGKLVVASKSPLTGGYGDGNLGTRASVNLRRAGFDALVIQGRADKPAYLNIENEKTEFLDASDLWGLNSYDAERLLLQRHGSASGVLLTGPAGEALVRYATIVSQEGRAGGRPGMGAVMGSKNLKAIVLNGEGDLKLADEVSLKKLGAEGFRDISTKSNYGFWKSQGTMATVEWCQENSTLPTHNFREGVFDGASGLSGATMAGMKTKNRGCPNCNMTCGNVIEDFQGREAELDYENVAMLGSDIGVGDLRKVAALNRMADELGIDTISLGSCIAFAMECSENRLVDQPLEWGDYDAAKQLTLDIAGRRGLGSALAEGVKRAADLIGGSSRRWAIHIKGLECSAYDCHMCPGMALSFATSPIGAHHKDAWIISWEVSSGKRPEYGEAKVEKVIEFQRIRGGMFESLVTCRFPWIELGFDLEWYPRFFEAATGVRMSLQDFYVAGDRTYSLMRAFWAREFGGNWGRRMDTPPVRWFNEPTTKGPLKGSVLDRARFDDMLLTYYKRRGWDTRGIPTRGTMEQLGLREESSELEKYVRLTT